MSLTVEDVRRVAQLAKLSISDAEATEMAGQLSKAVDLVQQLSAVNTDGVEPMVHAIEISNVLQKDSVAPSLDRELALKNAPSRDDECFRVPAVLG